jgi:hypothetical protein
MPPKKDSPSEIAKQTLTLLAKERRVPLPENYCDAYRAVDGSEEKWATYCRYTKLLEDALLELVRSWQVPGTLIEPETALLARELGQFVPASASEDDLKRVRDMGRDLGARIERNLTNGSALQGELIAVIRFVFANLGAFSEDDQWLHNQLQATGESLGGSVSADDVTRAKDVLCSVVDRQRELQKVITAAQFGIKAIMLEIVRQASSLVEDTAGYTDRMAQLGDRIRSSNDLTSIKTVVDELDSFVRDMGSSVRRSHDGMSATNARLVEAEQQIVELRRDGAGARAPWSAGSSRRALRRSANAAVRRAARRRNPRRRSPSMRWLTLTLVEEGHALQVGRQFVLAQALQVEQVEGEAGAHGIAADARRNRPRRIRAGAGRAPWRRRNRRRARRGRE